MQSFNFELNDTDTVVVVIVLIELNGNMLSSIPQVLLSRERHSY